MTGAQTGNDRAVGPPIEGLTYLEHLGSGGYSDVYLYERRKPRMRVAVKVLTDTRLSEAERQQFAAEAETMAELAGHPYIVQVFTTGTTADGRPYLVMKYYPPPNLGRRAATERFTVAEVLRTGIQVASAVQTAHRAGILHRDIKPANILVSQYGEPGLADFGIAGKAADAHGEHRNEEELGVSIPWSPPEVLTGTSNGSVASDVYSLAATLWHLLAGRSPHEVPGGDNSPRALMGRVLKSVPPATGRADVPASLERLLQQAMSKNPEHRPASALDFARSLQMIEQQLRYARTEIVVEDVDPGTGRDPGPRPRRDLGGEPGRDLVPPSTPDASPLPGGHRASDGFPASEPATRARPVVPEPATRARPVVPEPATRARPAVPAAAAEPPTRARPVTPSVDPDAITAVEPPPAAARERQGLAALPGAPVTVRRPSAPMPASVPPSATPTSSKSAGGESTDKPPAGRSKLPWFLVGGAVVAIIGVVLGLVLSGGGSAPAPREPTPSAPIGSDQAGFSGSIVSAPVIAKPAYDAKTRTLTFRWRASAVGGKPVRFVYSFGDGKQIGPTGATTASVKTTKPASTCITVGTVDERTGTRATTTACGT